MAGTRDIDVGLVTDNLPVRGFTWLMLALCIGAMLSEGYNLGVPGLAAPGIIKTLGATRASLAPVFSAALFGMLVGTLVAGYSGGARETAFYPMVGTETTGHAESVQITFDPKQVSFGRLLQIYLLDE